MVGDVIMKKEKEKKMKIRKYLKDLLEYCDLLEEDKDCDLYMYENNLIEENEEGKLLKVSDKEAIKFLEDHDATDHIYYTILKLREEVYNIDKTVY